MNKISNLIRLVVIISALLLSACGAAVATSTPSVGSGKVEPIPVAFLGLVDSITGDQWVINGQTVTVIPAAIEDGSFSVGDQVKVEGIVNSDGSFTVSSIEAPTPQDASSLPSFGGNGSGAGNENSSNENAVNENAANENSSNENQSNENGANENSSNENEANENGSNENEANENSSNENEGNENESNENEEHENEGNENGGGNESGSNENSGEKQENENESNSNDD